MEATITTEMNRRLLSRFKNELDAEQTTERVAAIAGLKDCESELSKVVPGLNAKIVAAVDNLNKVKAAAELAIKKATCELSEAQSARHRAVYPIERKRDGLQSRLQGELRHQAITNGLEKLDSIYESARSVQSLEIPDHPAGLPEFTRNVKPVIDRQKALFVWLRTAREQLLALQYSDSADIQLLVDAVMDGQPEN